MTIPKIAFSGLHNSGKTTLVRKVAKAMIARGIKVGVVKSTKHTLAQLNGPGTDTGLLAQDQIFPHGVVTQDAVGVFFEKEEDGLRLIESHLRGLDILILEGFKSNRELPKIWVERTGSKGYLSNSPKDVNGVIAVVSNTTVCTELPCFSFENIEAICDFIIEAALESKTR